MADKYIKLNEAIDLFKGIDADMTGEWVADTLESLADYELSEYGMTREAEKRVIDNARYEICREQRELLEFLQLDPDDYDCTEIEDFISKPSTFSLMQNIIAQGTSTAGGTSCWQEIYAVEDATGERWGDTK